MNRVKPMTSTRLVLAAARVICAATPGLVCPETLIEVWAVDSLVNVFQHAAPSDSRETAAAVARSEHTTLEVVVRGGSGIEELRAISAEL